MAHHPSQAIRAAAAVAALGIAIATPVHGALPLVAGLGKQLLQNLIFDGVKSQLIGSLAGSLGCKGAAVASLMSPGGLKRAAMPSAMQAMPNMPIGTPQVTGMPQAMAPMGAMPGVPAGANSAQMMA